MGPRSGCRWTRRFSSGRPRKRPARVFAAGEVAAVLFTGAAYFLPRLPKHLWSQFMSPSYHVHVLSTRSPHVDATRPHATGLVLRALAFTLDIATVGLRGRMRRRLPGGAG